jgi:hypothetical protein
MQPAQPEGSSTRAGTGPPCPENEKGALEGASLNGMTRDGRLTTPRVNVNSAVRKP